MQFKQTLLILILCPAFAFSQTTYLPQGDKQNILLERMEILAQNDSILNFSKTKPYSKKSTFFDLMNVYQMINHPDVDRNDPVLSRLNNLANKISSSRVDVYNLKSAVLNNQEWIATVAGQRNAE